MNSGQAFAQGARCGHLEGKDRTGQYVAGEEWLASLEASSANAEYINSVKAKGYNLPELCGAWAEGYRHGYRLAAEGEQLEACYENG